LALAAPNPSSAQVSDRKIPHPGGAQRAQGADTERMQPAAYPDTTSDTGSWRVSREGTPVAVVDLRHERGKVTVAAAIEGKKSHKPHQFGTVAAANDFIRELMTSFAYLGCDVTRD
jgi:hypothetical protein